MTLESKVQVLIDDLRDSYETRKQTFGDLAKSSNGKIESYCALGALGCQKRLIYIPDKGNWPVTPEYGTIINAYGINELLTKQFVFPILPYKDKERDVTMRSTNSLTSTITICNDTGYFNFKEIAKIIEVLSQNGYLSECSEDMEQNALSKQRAMNDAELKQKYESMPDL